MKKIILLCFTVSIIFNCKKEAPKVDYAIISGIIKNNSAGEFTINSFDGTFKEVLNVSETGNFADTLDTKFTDYVLFDGKNPIFIYIEDGYNLTINYDANDFENSLSISGVGSEINNYLVAKRKVEKDIFGQVNMTYALNENEFKDKIKAIKEAQDSLLNSSEGINENFKTKEAKNLNYGYLYKLSDYQNAHRYFTKNNDFEVSSNFLNELESVNYTNSDDYKFSNNYRNLVSNYYRKNAEDLAKTDSIANDIAYLKTLSNIENESIKNGLLFEYANRSMGYSDDLETFYNLYVSNSTNEENNTLIKEKYNKLIALNKGQPSPKFSGYENYKGGTSSLDDLKGKFVYIDVWATWCGPCIREIPSLKQVEKQYHDKNIEFVSISIDKLADHEKWKTMVDEKELGGMQLFADNDWNSKFVKDYQIQGIPRFILIDTEGNIVDANAPRPSSPELIELFTALDI